MTPIDRMPPGSPEHAAFETVIADAKVQALAGLLNIDLGNETVRNRVLAQAKDNYGAKLAAAPPVAPFGDSRGALPRSQADLTAYRIQEALRSYREIASV